MEHPQQSESRGRRSQTRKLAPSNIGKNVYNIRTELDSNPNKAPRYEHGGGCAG